MVMLQCPRQHQRNSGLAHVRTQSGLDCNEPALVPTRMDQFYKHGIAGNAHVMIAEKTEVYGE